MAKPSPELASRPRLLVLELWGLGDLALAVPFLRAAVQRMEVTLLAKPSAGPLLRHFVPEVNHVSFVAPWTSFRAKYRLHRWPWRELNRIRRELRRSQFDLGVSARPDPRDHALLAAAGARRRIGFARAGSGFLLNDVLTRPMNLHRAEHWRALAGRLDWPIDLWPTRRQPPTDHGRRVVMHTGAGHLVREWPRDRFDQIASHIRDRGYDVQIVDSSLADLDRLIDLLASASAFVGNDSGPGHLAALLGIPTFTIFGPQLPELFTPNHPDSASIEGAACPFKPCFDSCRFPEPRCLLGVTTEAAWRRIEPWLTRVMSP